MSTEGKHIKAVKKQYKPYYNKASRTVLKPCKYIDVNRCFKLVLHVYNAILLMVKNSRNSM